MNYLLKPQAEFLILTDRVKHNENGTYDFYGVHNHLVSDVFPVICGNFSYVLRLVGEPLAKVRFTAHIYFGLSEVARTDEIVVELNSIGDSVRLYSINTVRFEHPGAYQLAIRNEGTVLAHAQFTLVDKKDME